MDISAAISIFEFNGLEDVTKKNVTSKYRRLMKANHPDIGGDTQKAVKINEAYEVLKQILDQLINLNKLQEMSNKQIVFAIIPFNKLIEVYKGDNISLRLGEENFILNRRNIRAHKVMLDINCSVQVDGINYMFNTLSQMNIKDEYAIRCIIADTDIINDRKVNIKAYGKNVSLTVRGMTSTMILNFEGNVKLSVIVERRVIDNG